MGIVDACALFLRFNPGGSTSWSFVTAASCFKPTRFAIYLPLLELNVTVYGAFLDSLLLARGLLLNLLAFSGEDPDLGVVVCFYSLPVFVLSFLITKDFLSLCLGELFYQ